MISREEKNKSVVKKIQKEKARVIGNKIVRFFLIIICLFLLLFLYMYYLGIKGLKTNEIIIRDTSIPNSFYGMKILHFTDILYGSTVDMEKIEKLEEEIKRINPNIVFFTGNLLITNYNITEEEINDLNSFFKNIPYTIGKYAVKGNFDNATFDLIFENTDFTIINNEIYEMYSNTNDVINIIGMNYNEVKTITSNNSNYKIALINNFDDYSKYNIYANLVFAGNNLGGEIRIFNIGLLGNNKYKNNYYNENNTNIYISSGLGSIHHLRFMNHPSINVYRLYNK